MKQGVINPICGVCGNLKKIDGVKNPYCGFCSRLRCKKWRDTHPEERKKLAQQYTQTHKNSSRKNHLSRRYGLTKEEYDDLFQSQNGVCAICFQPETHRKHNTIWTLSVDHDHTTGKIRGLVCNMCNSGLARFKDSIDSLRSAVEYLERNQ